MSEKVFSPATKEQIEKSCRNWMNEYIEVLKKEEGVAYANPNLTDAEKEIYYTRLCEMIDADRSLVHFIAYPPYLELYCQMRTATLQSHDFLCNRENAAREAEERLKVLRYMHASIAERLKG